MQKVNDLDSLIGMGYEKADAGKALEEAKQDLCNAIDILSKQKQKKKDEYT